MILNIIYMKEYENFFIEKKKTISLKLRIVLINKKY